MHCLRLAVSRVPPVHPSSAISNLMPASPPSQRQKKREKSLYCTTITKKKNVSKRKKTVHVRLHGCQPTHLDLVVGRRDAVDDDDWRLAGVQDGQEAGSVHGEVLGVGGVDVHLLVGDGGVFEDGGDLHALSAAELDLTVIFCPIPCRKRTQDGRVPNVN